MATKRYGPYKGSAKNGGRPIYVYKSKKADGTTRTTSSNKARVEYEARNGKLPRHVDVDHKNNNKHDDSARNLRAIPKSKNVGKENKRRAGKK